MWIVTLVMLDLRPFFGNQARAGHICSAAGSSKNSMISIRNTPIAENTPNLRIGSMSLT